MPLYTQLPADMTEVDVIIAGGGAAGCIVAARLAEADPLLSILLIEYGKDNTGIPSIMFPALFPLNVMPDSDTAIFYQTEKSSQLNDRAPAFAAGGVLGGGTSINFMIYNRAQRDDFDSWKTDGWSTDELIPYLKKLETFHGLGDMKVHGNDGPMHVSDGTFACEPLRTEILAAAAKVGYPTVNSLQDLDTNNAFGVWHKYIAPDGSRQDTASRYLHPLLRSGKYPNLHVLTETKVSRVLLDETDTATAMEFFALSAETRKNEISPSFQTVKARKQIVISSGSLGTPRILERSGVGSAEILRQAGMEDIKVDLPGVGNNYQDHNIVFHPYKVVLPPGNSLMSVLKDQEAVGAAIANKSPLLGWNSIDVGSKVRPTEDEVTALGPAFRALWDRDYKDKPNRPMMHITGAAAALGDVSSLKEGDAVTMGTWTAYPYSRGSIHITSTSPIDQPRFDHGFLTDEHDLDLKMLVWAYKKAREIMRRSTFYRGEIASGHPRFPENSAAACIDLSLDSTYDPDNVTDIKYKLEDDKAIEMFIRDKVDTPWHSLGTCKMAPREAGGVVDKHLNVHGVKKLKIVDLSIAPENMCGNTSNAAMIIGEKGADIIIKELGL